MKSNKKILAITITIIVAVSIISGVFLYINYQQGPVGKMDSVTIALPPLEQDALMYVAANQRFFGNNNLNVTFRNYNSGTTAINSLLSGEANIAESAEYPFVNNAFQNQTISIIACNDEFQNSYIVALKNHGINNISDLKGKRIGVDKGTIAEFYLGRFLQLNGMNIQDVDLVNVIPSEYVSVIANGTVDALAAWQPYINQIQNQMGGIASWQLNSAQQAFGILICSNGWLSQHADVAERFLKALDEAQNYILNNPSKAKVIVQNQLNYTSSYIDSVWPLHDFSLSLDQSLVTAMQDEAQWMINNQFTNQTQIPNFTNYIYTRGLIAVNPQSVTLFT